MILGSIFLWKLIFFADSLIHEGWLPCVLAAGSDFATFKSQSMQKPRFVTYLPSFWAFFWVDQARLRIQSSALISVLGVRYSVSSQGIFARVLREYMVAVSMVWARISGLFILYHLIIKLLKGMCQYKLQKDIQIIFAFVGNWLNIYAYFYRCRTSMCLVYNTSSYKMLDGDILNDLNDLQSDGAIQQMDEQSSPNAELALGAESIKKSQLLSDPQFRTHMNILTSIIDSTIGKEDYQAPLPQDVLIQRSNEYANTINKEINAIFRLVKGAYNRKFPELESIITNPALYCKAVREIQALDKGEKMEQNGSQTAGRFAYLSNHQKISLEIALSSIHEKLSAAETDILMENVETVVQLNEDNAVLIMYLETCMKAIAPNLCQLLGSLVASKLIALAGGVKELAAIPACNIQVMGGQRFGQIGLNISDRNHTGIFGSIDFVRDAQQRYKMQLVRMLASNTAKCVRADVLKSQAGLGARLREEIFERYEKIQEEGGLSRIDQPLPVPDQQPKKRRGGKRYRKTKQLYEMSELRKQQNRLKFGEEGQEEIQEGVGLGMLSQGAGKLRINIKKAKVKVSKKMAQRMTKTSGLESSLNLGAAQGIELINPLQPQAETSGKQTIFSKSSGFQTVLNNKFGSLK